MIFDDMLYDPTFAYVKKEPYTGSFKGKRYRIWTETKEIDEKKVSFLWACVYPDRFCFEKTDDADKISQDFDYSNDGLQQAKAFIENNILGK